MRIAFYAPMKPPDHPVPSGDRRMSRLLIAALGRAGHEVELASRLRSREGTGSPERQARLRRVGAGLARRLLRRYHARPPAQRPRAWLTYHLYYKAPDWIGPAVCEALEIPYLIAEASVAGKRAGGPWDLGHRATLAALERAAAVIALNPVDVEGLPQPSRLRSLKPFLDPVPYREAAEARAGHRKTIADRFGLETNACWFAAVAMMRPGDKLASYRLLAKALEPLQHSAWQLIIVGAGPARGEVEGAFAWARPGQIHFAGEIRDEDLPGLYAACDLLAWPAINEAYGMALLEAQASGLPVVAGASGGVPGIVGDGETGILTPPGDTAAFTAALGRLVCDPALRRDMARRARRKVEAEHGIDGAADRLDQVLREAAGKA
jgi:glycosyltransferase involved in cell wall biosynthesis